LPLLLFLSVGKGRLNTVMLQAAQPLKVKQKHKQGQKLQPKSHYVIIAAINVSFISTFIISSYILHYLFCVYFSTSLHAPEI